MSLNTHPELAGAGAWGAAAADLPAPALPAPALPAPSAIDRARADYHAALMSDPSAPGYDRLCSMMEERVRDAEAAQPVAVDAAGAAGHSSLPPRDFSALLEPRRRDHDWIALRRAAATPEIRSTVDRAEMAEAVAADGQAALDREWASANIGGPGCPFCDSMMGGCGCWAERAEMHKLQERRERKARQAAAAAAAAAGKCSCDLEFSPEDIANGAACAVCQAYDEARCDHCNSYPCQARCCGGCGACEDCRGPPCKRCGEDGDRCYCYEDDDRESECDCGACEEHDDRDEGCW